MPLYAPPSAGTSPTTTRGDIIKRGASADERLAIGTEDQVLTVVDIGGGVLEPRYAANAPGGSNATQLDGTPLETTSPAAGQIISYVMNASAQLEARNRLSGGLDLRDYGTGGVKLAAYGDAGTLPTTTTLTDSNYNTLYGDFNAAQPLNWGRGFQAGDPIIVWRARSGGFAAKVTTIDSVTATTITLTSAVTNTPAAGTVRWAVGWPTSQHTDINAAMVLASARGYGEVVLPGLAFVNGTVLVQNRVTFRGLNHRQSGLILMNTAASGTHVLRNKVSSNGTTDRNALFYQIRDMYIEGNRDNVSGSGKGVYLSYVGSGGSAYARLPNDGDEEDDVQAILANLFVASTHGDGIFWEGLASTFLSNSSVELNGGAGFVGTSDFHAYGLVAGLTGREGFKFSPAASSNFAVCKSFGSGNDVHSQGQGFLISGGSGGISMAACDAQENWAEGLKITTSNVVFQGTMDSNCVDNKTNPGTYAAINLAGAQNVVIDATCFDTNFEFDGGNQKNALTLSSNPSGRVRITHGTEDKGYEEPYIGSILLPTSQAPYRIKIEVGGEGAIMVGDTWPTAVQPAAPTMSNIAMAGGTIADRATHYSAYTWVYADGSESVISAEATNDPAANRTFTVAVGAFPAGVVAARVYIGSASGSKKAQPHLIRSSSGTWREPPQGFLDAADAAHGIPAPLAPPSAIRLLPDPDERTHVIKTLAGNITIENPVYPRIGQRMDFSLPQDGTGGRKLTWGSAYTVRSIQNLQASAPFNVGFVYNGTNWLEVDAAATLLFAQQSVQTTGGTLNAGDTIANSTANNLFATTATIPAGQLKAGHVLRIKALGIHSSTATPTGTLTLFGGATSATTLATSAANTYAGNTNAVWDAEIWLTILTTGASGTAEVHGVFDIQKNTANSQEAGMKNGANGTAVTIDTTVDNVLALAHQWSAASTSNTITMRQLVVERVA